MGKIAQENTAQQLDMSGSFNINFIMNWYVSDNIVASLVATQDSEGKNETVTRKDFEVGQVKLQISIHDPSKLFRLNNISYDWNFGDGTRLNSSLLNKLSHNFTEDIGSYNVTVELRGWALGREYSGSTSKILTFKGMCFGFLLTFISFHLVIPNLKPLTVTVKQQLCSVANH